MKDDAGSIVKVEEKRPTFTSNMIGTEPGTVLTHLHNENVTSRVIGDRHVLFRGENMSHFRSALIVTNETGRNWPAVQGAKYWLHPGERLHKLRLKYEAADS